MADAPSNVHPLTHKFLGKEMYLVVTRPVRSPEIEKRLSEHLAHQVELERKGIMFAAGPLYSKGSQTPEAGMFVLRANSFEEAEAICKTDPLHEAGLADLHHPEMAGERRQHHAEGELLRPDGGDRLIRNLADCLQITVMSSPRKRGPMVPHAMASGILDAPLARG